MRKSTINTITEAINAETRQQVRNTLETLRAKIWLKYNMRQQVLDSSTGFQLVLDMHGARFNTAYVKRQNLWTRNEEAIKIITLIERELAKL